MKNIRPHLTLQQIPNQWRIASAAKPFRIVVLGLALLLSISSIHAATITVQSTGDGAANAANCPSAGCRLRDALAKAVDNDTINFSVNGAIVLNSGELLVTKSVTISGPGANLLAVSGNNASRVFHISPGKTVTISGLTITKGSAGNGGGIYNDHATLTIGNCTITGNSTSVNNGGGGGIYSDSTSGSAMLTINNSTVSGNSAFAGGGINNFGSNSGTATLTISNSTISGNLASNGGGIYNACTGNNSTATLTVSNSTLSGNSATSIGGGIYNIAQAFSGNTATVTLGSTIINAGAGASGENIRNDFGTVTSNGHNLDSDGSSGFTNGTNGDIVGTAGSPIDPKLGPLQDNGGPTFTHALLLLSPAIDKGKDLSSTGKDQRGRTRPVDYPDINATGGDGSDIGAFEGVARVVINTDDSGAGSLRQALADSSDNDVIYFDPSLNGQTITLTTGELVVGKSVTISGPGANVLAVNGNANGRVFHISPGKTATISGLTLTNGNINGGGILNDHATLTVSNCTISGNLGAAGGGGIYNFGDTNGGSATLTINSSTISGNTASTDGGGIRNDGQNGGNAILTINNSTISGNSASQGGGILNTGENGGHATLTINNSTLSGNSASQGGGIYNDPLGSATLTIGNTILNAGTSGRNILGSSGAVTSSGFNLSNDNESTLLKDPTDQNGIDPKLGPLQDNGGTTLTHALLLGSPAIDQGKDLSGTGQDQRGIGRPLDDPNTTNTSGGDGSDIGAVEMRIRVVTNTTDNNAGSLRQLLANAFDGDLIYFNLPANSPTIVLTSGELVVGRNVNISGPGANLLAIDGNHASRVFHISAGKTATISGLTIRNGLATGGFPDVFGGGIYNDHATLTISDATLSDNSAYEGGGIYNSGESSGSATLMITNSTLSGNSAMSSDSNGGEGGGIFNDGFSGSATLTITNSTLSDNFATNLGAGIFNDGDSSGSATLTITNSTVSGNHADVAGAAIFNDAHTNGSAPLTITNCTLSNNSGQSGVIHNFGSSGSAPITIGNTILNGSAGPSNIVNDSGTVTSSGHNLSNDGGVTNQNTGTGLLNATGDQVNTDPKLGPLTNNGGPTLTHALLLGSPAIDKGKDLSGTGKDQRGRSRPFDDPDIANASGGAGSDIGAVETVTHKVTNTNDSGAGSLRQVLAASLDGDLVDFNLPANSPTILLTSGELVVGTSVDISGPGANKLAVDGNANSRVFHISPGKTATISGLTIRNGNGKAAFPGDLGGGIYNDHAILTVTDSTISQNQSDFAGAGIFNDGTSSGGATLTIRNSTVSGNAAANYGGGIYNAGQLGGSATLTISNSTVSGNSASANDGGGIYSNGVGAGSAAIVTVTNCTLSGNSAANHGGGIFISRPSSGTATLTIGNTILNAGASGENIFNLGGTVTSKGYNLSSDAGVTNSNGGTGALNATGDQIKKDPKLGPLQDNGGSTFTHALLPGSPALDKGNNTLALAAGLTTDGRGTGFARVLDAASDADTTQTVDIGAFEADPSIEDISNKSTPEDTPLSFTFKVGDSATPFDSDSVTASSSNTTLLPNSNIVVDFDTDSTRKLTLTPAANLSGTTTVTVKVTKTIGGAPISMSDTFVLTVTAVNDPPVANSQSVTTKEDTAKAITLIGSDVDGDALTFSVVAGPAHGTLSGTAPNLSYKPNANYHGPDSFTFKANDGKVDSNVATVSIAVTAVNDAPVANAQSITTKEDTAKALTLAGFDVDGDALTFSVVTAPTKGTLSGTAPNLTYKPNANYHGADSFTFKANDGTVDSSTATVSITVVAVNDAPVANAQSITTKEDTAKAVTLAGFDVDGDALTFSVVTAPTKGTLSGTAPNLTYKPNANYHGGDSFIFKVNDGTVDSSTATVSITVVAVNDAPVANAQSVTTQEATEKAITVTASDVDGGALTFSVVAGPTNGTLSGTPPNLTYKPNANYSGPDSFTFKANDGHVDSNTATVTITVAPAARALNISTRLAVQTGENVLIEGFIVSGPAGSTKKVMVRGLGPSLVNQGVPAALVLTDPYLELHHAGVVKPIAANDDWQQGDTSQIPDGFQPKDPKESLLIATLPVSAEGFSNYTAILKGANEEMGIALAEIYDLDPGSSPTQLVNISTRGFVQGGDNVMIGGFILGASDGGTSILIRALGPSLSKAGVQDALPDPTLTVRNGNGERVASNDNWKINDDTGTSQEAEIRATTIPPDSDLESAVVGEYPPGKYTAIVADKGGASGVGLIEVYNRK